MTFLSDQNKAILKEQWRVTRFPFLLEIVWASLAFYLTPESKRYFITWFKDFVVVKFCCKSPALLVDRKLAVSLTNDTNKQRNN